jgi:KDO2-lipid IV(A) lauroyltransferase
MIRQKDFTYKVEMYELKYDDLQNSKEGIYELTRRYADFLEQKVRQYPDHWVWQHRRWKHTIEYADAENN